MADMKMSRRALAKGLAVSGTAMGLSRLMGAEGTSQDASPEASSWEQVHPGVWRATLGTPEKFTPVGSRLVPALDEGFAKLPQVDAAPLPAITGTRLARGFMVALPLKPGEEIYGLGLQMMSLAQRGKKKVARVNADPKMDRATRMRRCHFM